MNVAYILLAMVVLMVFLLAWDAAYGDLGEDERATVLRPDPPEHHATPDGWHRAGESVTKAGLLLMGLVLAAAIEFGPYLLLDAILGDGGSPSTTCLDLSALPDADRAAIEAAPARLNATSPDPEPINLDDLIRACDP